MKKIKAGKPVYKLKGSPRRGAEPVLRHHHHLRAAAPAQGQGEPDRRPDRSDLGPAFAVGLGGDTAWQASRKRDASATRPADIQAGRRPAGAGQPTAPTAAATRPPACSTRRPSWPGRDAPPYRREGCSPPDSRCAPDGRDRRGLAPARAPDDQSSAPPSPPTPAAPTTAWSRRSVTGFQTSIGNPKNPFVAPEDGEIVAWSLKLGKPQQERPPGLQRGVRRRPRPGIGILSRCPGRRNPTRYKLLRQSPVEDLGPFFGADHDLQPRRAAADPRGRDRGADDPDAGPPPSRSARARATEWMASRRPTKKRGGCTDDEGRANVDAGAPQTKKGTQRPYGCDVRPRAPAVLGDLPARPSRPRTPSRRPRGSPCRPARTPPRASPAPEACRSWPSPPGRGRSLRAAGAAGLRLVGVVAVSVVSVGAVGTVSSTEIVGSVDLVSSSSPQPAPTSAPRARAARASSRAVARAPAHESPSRAGWRRPQYGQSLTSRPIS